ncbi:MAG TPA: LysM peptidoglycan-binding domain-containing protein [Parafilimonas sp.]|nr:LysM peptidoglycan-binding domain-containing protein [Parafilimonas sp.]
MRNLFYLAAVILFLCSTQPASSQSSYVSHTLKTGETLSDLAKQYNTNVGDIMRMNGMHADSKLVYGSVIKIPSTKTNTVKPQQAQSVIHNTTVSAGNAITHTVVKGETLYSISKKYGVSVAELKEWNNLSDNSAKLGSNLIVGQNANSSSALNAPVADTKRQRVETMQQTPSQSQQETGSSNSDIEDQKTNVDATSNNKISNTQTTTSVVENNNTTAVDLTPVNGEGFFEDQFSGKAKHKQHISGVSKTFKTASGWSDGKYYILADNISPGTVVKLTADNGKTVYAKVLWNMGDLKENSGVDFRVSNATAAALNENNPAFNITVYY